MITRMKQALPTPGAGFYGRSAGRRLLAGLMILGALLVVISVLSARRRANRGLEGARASLERAGMVPIEKQIRQGARPVGVSFLQNYRGARDLIEFEGSYFAATEGGLLEYARDGKVKRIYTVLDGLPESDLLSLAVFQSKLAIGSRSQGMALFDGKKFETIRWTDRQAQAVTALTEDRGRLLVGTFAGGLLEFDGKKFTELKAGTDPRPIPGIACLVATPERLLVGTFRDGVWIRQGDVWTQLTVADGLPSNRVVGVVEFDGVWLVVTDFGVASIADPIAPSGKRVTTLATLPSLSGAAVLGGQVLLCKDDGSLFRLEFEKRAGSASAIPLEPSGAGRSQPADLSSCRLRAFGATTGQTSGQRPEQALWLLSAEGVWRINGQDERSAGRPRLSSFGDLDSLDGLSNNIISAMALDAQGRLWAGSFRRGMDVFSAEGRRLAHLESESVREINALIWDETARRMLAATSAGLLQFSENFGVERLGAEHGLPSDSILHVTRAATGTTLATSRGISFVEGIQRRVLTTVQRLPSNSVYALARRREFLYAGTLGGLAEIAAGRVVRVYNDSNSKLTTNWTSALTVVKDRLFVGTYGGGVFELTPAGEFTSFASQIGKQTVNPNAMWADAQRLYVGTLDGVWAMDLDSGKWMHLRDELPSRTILSITGNERETYFGATNGVARIESSFWRASGE